MPRWLPARLPSWPAPRRYLLGNDIRRAHRSERSAAAVMYQRCIKPSCTALSVRFGAVRELPGRWDCPAQADTGRTPLQAALQAEVTGVRAAAPASGRDHIDTPGVTPAVTPILRSRRLNRAIYIGFCDRRRRDPGSPLLPPPGQRPSTGVRRDSQTPFLNWSPVGHPSTASGPFRQALLPVDVARSAKPKRVKGLNGSFVVRGKAANGEGSIDHGWAVSVMTRRARRSRS